MSCDRFIYFETLPDPAEIRRFVTSWIGLGDAAIADFPSRRADCPDFIVNLLGTGFDPRGVGSIRAERWIEFRFQDRDEDDGPEPLEPSIDVLTRDQDDLVHCIARGLADRIAALFNGRRETDG